jgi:hypothetical protein
MLSNWPLSKVNIAVIGRIGMTPDYPAFSEVRLDY